MLVCKDHDNTIRWQKDERLDRLFEKKCDTLEKKKNGEHPALIVNDAVTTYKELDERANQLARYLLKRGIHSGDRIGILIEKSVDTYVSLLAVIKANAAYVPLDPGFPRERISYIAKDADLGLIISTSSFSHHLGNMSVSLLFLDVAAHDISKESKTRLCEEDKDNPKDQLCYIIYTSGSTGNPKGVAIDHPSICNFVRVAGEVYGVGGNDRVYQGMTIAFDFSVEEIWVPLIAGATLVSGPSGACRLGDDLAYFLNKHKVSVMCCVPTLLATIEQAIPSLRLLLVGGEACPHELVVKWHRPGRTILNTYGPTQATVTATWTVLLPEKPVTIGQPLPTYSIVILDEEQRPVPKGVHGEICIAGIGLARGYVNRDDLNRKYFIPDFLGTPNKPSQCIYRTSDLRRITDENEIEYHGCIDTQEKIRGYRIGLIEIESVLLHKSLKLNSMLSALLRLNLVALCTLKKGASNLPENIPQKLAERLPGYMIPAFIQIISKIPLLARNKADRKKLLEPSTLRICWKG